MKELKLEFASFSFLEAQDMEKLGKAIGKLKNNLESLTIFNEGNEI